jgi:dTDP-glucose 4,6-dehydratase
VRILVTGGAGFIGSNFVRRTIATRPDVSIIVLDALTYAGRLSNLAGLEGKYEFVEGDIRDVELVGSLVSQVDAVVHFAAESHNDNSLHAPRSFIETNVLGTFEIIQACVKHGVRLHHISTDEVFGDLPLHGDEKFTPTTPYNPSSPYSASKASSDLLVRAWVRSFGLKATISNCSNNYGPYQHEEKLIPRTILLAASGIKPKVYGQGLNVRDWIHVDDHTDGVWAVLDRGWVEGKAATYLLGSNGERNNLQVVRVILATLDLPQDFIEFVPDRPGHDLRYAIDASETVSALGWKQKFKSFEAGLPSVVDFYVSQLKSGFYSGEQLAQLGISDLSVTN